MGRALGRGLPTWQLGADETTPMARFSCRSACVRFWHNADIPVAPIHVNVAGERRCHATGTRASQFTAKQSCEPLRSARCVLDRRFEALCVEGRHTLDPPQTLGGVPDRECEHRLRIRGIDDVDEVVVALRVVDRLYLDTQFVELCLGLPDSLRLLACVLRVQISKQHIFHGHLPATPPKVMDLMRHAQVASAARADPIRGDVCRHTWERVMTTPDSAKRVAMACLVGTSIEWYDFFIYGTASALVLPKLFFPSVDPAAGTLLSFSTFALAFIVRPIGGLIFGHFGDRVGRKALLVTTVLLVGTATTLIGLLPTYASIGVAAPWLLVV